MRNRTKEGAATLDKTKKCLHRTSGTGRKQTIRFIPSKKETIRVRKRPVGQARTDKGGKKIDTGGEKWAIKYPFKRGDT